MMKVFFVHGKLYIEVVVTRRENVSGYFFADIEKHE